MTQSAPVPSVFTFTTQTVRVVLVEDAPWFVAADVCAALEIDNNRQALARLDDDEKGVISNDTPGGRQEVGIINESGLYSLILGSRKPAAKRFKKWVTSEVLPAIRQHGRYELTPQPAPGLDSEQLATLATAIRRCSIGWVFGAATGARIHNRLRVTFGVREVALLSPEQYRAALAILAEQQQASEEFLTLIMEVRDWFDSEVAGGGTPWTPAIKARLARQMKARVALPAQVDWLALARQAAQEDAS